MTFKLKMSELTVFRVVTLCLMLLICLNTAAHRPLNSKPIRLGWATYLRGRGTADNFSFAKKWDYPLGVVRMSNGKPGCADGGFCPERCQNMLGKNGRIPRDSVTVFYSLLDTTHIHHSIQSTAWCYEWAGTDFVRAFRVKSATGGSDTVRCESAMNEATHCSLRLDFVLPYCYASIILNSITPGGTKQFFGEGGTIKLDKSRWKRGIIKARFDLTFTNTTEPSRPMFWRGKILIPVE